jgi:hypothetical protein
METEGKIRPRDPPTTPRAMLRMQRGMPLTLFNALRDLTAQA